MPFTRSGTATIQVNATNLKQMMDAQLHCIQKGIYDERSDTLSTALNSCLTVLGFIVTKAPTPVGVAVAVVSLAVGMLPNEKDNLSRVEHLGRDWLYEQYSWLVDRPQYDLIEISYPYLEYYNVDGDKEVRWCAGSGILKRVRTTSGDWIEG